MHIMCHVLYYITHSGNQKFLPSVFNSNGKMTWKNKQGHKIECLMVGGIAKEQTHFRERISLKSKWPFCRAFGWYEGPWLDHNQGGRLPGKGSKRTKPIGTRACLVYSCARQTQNITDIIKSSQHQMMMLKNVQNKNKLYHTQLPQRPNCVSISWKFSTSNVIDF